VRQAIIAVIILVAMSLNAMADFAGDFQAAKKLFAQKQYADAQQAFAKLAASAPNDHGKAASLSYAAMALGRQNQYEKAIELSKSIEAGPMAAYTQMTLMTENRKFKELAAAFKEEDVAAWPDDINYKGFSMRGRARNIARDRKGALSDFEQCVALAGSDLWTKLEAMENVASVHHALGDDAKAMDIYRDTLAVYEEEPGRKGLWLYPKTLLGAVGILIGQKKYDDAQALLAEFGDTSEERKRNVYGFLVLEAYGDIHAGQGKKAEALEKYRDALGIQTQPGYINRVEKKVAELEGGGEPQ